jgi:hypothetical protein
VSVGELLNRTSLEVFRMLLFLLFKDLLISFVLCSCLLKDFSKFESLRLVCKFSYCELL